MGGGVVQSLAKGISSQDDRFMVNSLIQKEFKLSKSQSLADIAKNFESTKYPSADKHNKSNNKFLLDEKNLSG